MKQMKIYPTIGVCGLDCGLCPRYYTVGPSRCPGCCGPDFFDKHPSCSFITCCVKKKNLEVCAECLEFPCSKFKSDEEYKQLKESSSYPSCKKVISNLNFIKEYGIEKFIEQQKRRIKSQAGGFWDKERKQPINSQATIKWVLQNENITTVLSGMSTVEQLQQNIALMTNLKLTEQEKNDLRLTSTDRIPGLYCQQCNRCIPQCPNKYDIPTAMRSFMYAYGYKDLRYAKETLGYAKIPANPCEGCDRCNVNCTMGFDVRAKVQDIVRLNNVPGEFLFV